MIPLYRKGLVRLGRLLLRSTVLRPFGLSRQEASHRFAPLPHIADLRCLNDNPPPPRPLPWWIRNHDLLACVACICIWAVTFYAIGGL
jgi:hypothetical protein